MTDTLGAVDLKAPPQADEPQEEKKEEKEKEKTLADYLAAFEGAPDEPLIEKWKQEFGEALCSGLSETELYIFRPISREEFVNLQAYVQQMQQKGEEVSNFDVEVKVVETCVLWASPQGVSSLSKKAGTYATLHEQILQASNFMNAAYVSQLVVKL